MSDLDDAAKRIIEMTRRGKSKRNSAIEAFDRGEVEKTSGDTCPECGQEIKDDTTHEAEMMDRGVLRRR